MRTVCLLLLSLFFIECAAQDPVIGQLAQPETLDNGSMEQLYEDIEDLKEAPLDLNIATRAQLEALPFLSPQQVMDIIEYRDRVKRIETFCSSRYLVLCPATTAVSQASNGRQPSVKRPSANRQTAVSHLVKRPLYHHLPCTGDASQAKMNLTNS